MLQLVGVILLVIVLALHCWLLIWMSQVRAEVVQMCVDMSQLRKILIPPSVGGRSVPSGAEIAAARARADTFPQNQVDRSGVAQVGGPPKS